MKVKLSPSFSRLINATTPRSYWAKFDAAVKNLQLAHIEEKTKQLEAFMATLTAPLQTEQKWLKPPDK